jgi:hypothetical protein
MKIDHMARHGQNQFLGRGELGQRSFAVQPDDDVTVRAELSEPAYAYLIAFRPDGVDELCDPADPEGRPRKTQQPSYPRAGRTNKVYRLNDGAGLHAFAVVASRNPLPPYRQWKGQHRIQGWSKGLSSAPGVVWWHDGEGLFPLTAEDPGGQRSQGATIGGGGAAVADLADQLRDLPGVDAVAVKAFPVPPAAARDQPPLLPRFGRVAVEALPVPPAAGRDPARPGR